MKGTNAKYPGYTSLRLDRAERILLTRIIGALSLKTGEMWSMADVIREALRELAKREKVA
jgi:hypothetical protein